MKVKHLAACLILAFFVRVSGQTVPHAESYHISSRHTSFPDTGRRAGHFYDHVLYSATEHYQDSSVLIVVPNGLKAGKKLDLIFWFHGWRNNVDTALARYALERQFLASGKNAVLVLPETAKDAPDSYGGRLENYGDFRALTGDIMASLRQRQLISGSCTAGNLLIGGHSGAYRVIAGILRNGQMEVNEVFLFDALYANTETYVDWIKSGRRHRFIDLYTDSGGTAFETKRLKRLLDTAGLSPAEREEAEVNARWLRDHRLIFIHSGREHDKIIADPDNFELFLSVSPFLQRLKTAD